MNDDIDDEILGSDEPIDDVGSNKGLMGQLKNNPAFKVGAVLLAGVLVLGIFYFFNGEEKKPIVSNVGEGSEVRSAPGATKGATPEYIEAVEAENEASLEKALNEGGSNVPVPVENLSDRLVVPEDQEEEGKAEEDPLLRWRKLQEERLTRDITNQEEAEPLTVVDSEEQSETVKKLSEAMSKQMQSVLGEEGEVKTFNYVKLIDYVKKDGATENGQQEGENNQQGQPGSGFDELDSAGIEEETKEEVIIPAGEIEYAQLILEANSDVPGPVLALLVSGPLSGSKMIGTFSVVDEYLTLTFDTVVVDKESYSINAIALDPATTLPGMATEVDHRYFKRIVLPAAAAFVEGFADAMSQSESTQITIDTGSTSTTTEADLSTEQEVANGIKEAGEEVRDIIEEINEGTKMMVKIHAGTPVGVLFTEPVTQEDDET